MTKILIVVLLVAVAVVWAVVRIAGTCEQLRRARAQWQLDRWHADRCYADDPNAPPGGAV